MKFLDRGDQVLEVPLHGCGSLTWNCAKLQGKHAVSSRLPGAVRKIIMFFANYVERVRGKSRKLGVWHEGHPIVGWNRTKARSDASDQFNLLLDRVYVRGARFLAIAKK